MKTPAKCIAWLLPLMLTGCFHRHKQKPPEHALAPPIVASPALITPPPATQPASAGNVAASRQTSQPGPEPEQQLATEEIPEKPPVHHKKPASHSVEEAAAGSPGVSATGQLSYGDPSDLRNQVITSIAETERGLKDLNHSLSDQEKKTIDQIREFIKQAKAALLAGDVDGANTLALKAKVLFGELKH